MCKKNKMTESFVLLKAIKCVKNIYYSKYNMLLGHLFIKMLLKGPKGGKQVGQKIVSNDDNKCQIKKEWTSAFILTK